MYWDPVRIGLHGIEEQALTVDVVVERRFWTGRRDGLDRIVEPEVEHLPAESHEGPPQWRKDPAPRSHYWKQGFDARI